jgi:hypothetical protein
LATAGGVLKQSVVLVVGEHVALGIDGHRRGSVLLVRNWTRPAAACGELDNVIVDVRVEGEHIAGRVDGEAAGSAPSGAHGRLRSPREHLNDMRAAVDGEHRPRVWQVGVAIGR